MRSAQRLGWLSSSYGSTLATKLDGAQGKAGLLVKDETVQSGRCCVMIERVVQTSQSSARCWTLKGAVETVLAKGHNLASVFTGAEQGMTQEWGDEGELPRSELKIGDAGGPMMCWQRSHVEKS
ncbi:hypothetical protein GW17_00058739 [Ensete ventricosum]|nr:hypothetical protein GW17_00058739 [Ensete ventricosum]